ncbi:RHS repeat-associated core domain-containing protein [Nafulsella turpanensis]|uniref:RHS repeat-associated core domain-containing protein n=1 Tax=Nafulsella turpanensis TaxID=1265690 RepID=UPI000344AF07|nr:RHS repeat-associated core domain-containing protein [Nafulsella turpanensis]
MQAETQKNCTYTYRLKRNNELYDNGTGGEITFTVQDNGDYQLIAMNGTNTFTSAVVTIAGIETAVEKPEFGGSLTRTVCPSSNRKTSTKLGTATSQIGVQYKLYRGETLLSEEEGNGGAISFGEFDEAGDYIIHAEKTGEANKCKSNSEKSSVLTIVVENPEVFISADYSGSCEGGSVKLSTSFDSRRFRWYKGDELLHDGALTEYTVTEEGSYSVEAVSDVCGDFVSSGPYTVSFPDKKVVSLSLQSDKNEVCSEDLITFTASVTNGGTASEFEWYVNGERDRRFNGSTLIVSPSGIGEALEVECKFTSNATGCFESKTASASIGIPILFQTVHEVVVSGNECIPLEEAVIRVFDSQSDANYTLYNYYGPVGNPVTGNSGELNFPIPEAGTFWIGASGTNGCGNTVFSESFHFPGTASGESISIETTYSLTQCAGSNVELTAVGPGSIISYGWYNENNEIIEAGETLKVNINQSNHTFTLKGFSRGGCVFSDEIIFTVDKNLQKPEHLPYFRLSENKELELYLNNYRTEEYEFFWVDSPEAEGTLTYPEPRVVTEPGFYYVRSRNSNGCWGPATSVFVPDFTIPVYENGLTQGNINYVQTYTYQQKELADDPATYPVDKVGLNTVYFDGLGRPIQVVEKQGSPERQDIVSPIFYSELGRREREFLPYEAADNSGNIAGQPFEALEDFYQDQAKKDVARDDFPFSTTIFEPSPLNRTDEVGAPGFAWQPGTDHQVKVAYSVNLAEDKIIEWNYYKNKEKDSFGHISADDYYEKGELNITETIEGEQVVKEYKDKLGRTILKEVIGDKLEIFQTYYVYDVYGNLRAVLPPQFMEDWQAAGGAVQESQAGGRYAGYKVVADKLSTNDVTEGNQYLIRKEGKLLLTPGFKADAKKGKFHAVTEKAGEPVEKILMSNFIFYYHYDERQRMVEKHVPGGGITYMVYDPWDRLVLTQDAEQREDDQWLYTKYDALNRPVVTGLWKDTDGKERADLQQDVADGVEEKAFARYEERDNSKSHGYSMDKSFPDDAKVGEVLTVSYYDNYDFKFSSSDALTIAEDRQGPYDYNAPEGFEDKRFLRVQGQVTGSKTRVLETDSWIHTVTYYDDKYRPIQTVSNNQQEGMDRLTQAYDFTGKVLKNLQQHAGSVEVDILKEFIYDHTGRLEQTWQTIDGDIENKILLAENEYNALGELVDKKLHSEDEGGNFLQSVDYRYNIRGWLTSINNSSLAVDDANDDADDFFGMELGYIHDFGLGADELNYNGNITAIKWSANLGLDATENQRAYTYGYDGLSRIKEADYHSKGAAWAGQQAYKLYDLSYDKNGNIQSLSRKGVDGNEMDVLSYEYENEGNRLSYVSDNSFNGEGFKDGNTSGADYEYYLNGNLKKDKNRGISEIRYNHLNLPKEVIFADGNKITYTYDAAGIKLSQLVEKEGEEPKLTEYIGGIVYENGQLQFIQHEEGRVVYNNREDNPFEYQYHLKDHLGNVRTSFTSRDKVDEATATMETAHEEEEWSQFLHYEEVTKINSELFDHTNEGSTFYSMRLSGTEREQIGLAKSLAVNPGDVVSAKVFAKYLDPNHDNWSEALANLMAAIAAGTAPAGTFIEGAGISQQNFGFAGMLAKGETEQGVKAYLNVLIVDKNFTFLDGGYEAVGAAGREDGSNVPHQELSSKEYTITQPGYVYVWLSNENEQPVEVYFDDFTVTHKHSKVIQADDYFPFGLTFNSYVSGDKNKFLYQGKELQEDLGLGTFDFEARIYDPAIGRTFQLDPHADNYFDLSPYSWAGNNPMLMIDPTGKDFIIWYTNEDGKQESFRFNGSNAGKAPDNEYVQQFVAAYNYSVENGGGEKMQAIATNNELAVGVTKTEDGSVLSAGYIYWNPEGGAAYENGTVVSPSTVLEHESDHALARHTEYPEFNDRRKTPDARYTNKEERRVITGSEQKTARANGEISSTGVTRTSHSGDLVITTGPTSNKIDRRATYNYYLKMKRQGYNVDKQLKKYGSK